MKIVNHIDKVNSDKYNSIQIVKQVKNLKIKKLLEHYKEISLLTKISALLDWDLNVNLPAKGADLRAQESAYLAGTITDKWLDSEFRKNLESLQGVENSLSGVEKAVVRNLNRAAKYYLKVPKEIIVKKSEVVSKAFMIWQKARKDNRFADFLPILEELINLDKIIASHLGYKRNPYDALLDQFEPGLTFALAKKIFKKLQPELTNLLKKITKAKGFSKGSQLVEGLFNYPISEQKQLSLFVTKKMGYDYGAGRLDVSAHPFTLEMGQSDVRITTRYNEKDFRESFTSSVHEAGHALYEQGINEEFEATPLEGGVSFAIHESQSRFWENQIGRNPNFLEYLTPIFQAFYPGQLEGVGSETLTKLFNMVKPSLIRVEADEVTYCLHIILRFELENDLINGKLRTADLARAWNKKMKKYLGVVPATERDGVLQDVHWSHGNFGYFPTYALGNLYAAQFTNQMKKELPFDELLKRGEYGTILSWLRENIHQYGSLYWPDELIKKVTGKSLDPGYFISYLKEKYASLYGFKG